MTIFTRQFSAGEVIAAADITMNTLQNWMRRKVIVGHKDIEGGGEKGKHRRFSWFNVMEIATAAELTRLGVSDLPLAFSAAMYFAHAGHGDIGYRPMRYPGLPWNVEHGRTILCMAGDRCAVELWKPGTDALATVRIALGAPTGFVVIDMLELFDMVSARLGIHPQAVLDEAYQREAATEPAQ